MPFETLNEGGPPRGSATDTDLTPSTSAIANSVLIVEDDMLLSDALAQMIEVAGYHPVQVFCIDDWLRAGSFDARFIILDVTLKNGDAVDVILALAATQFKGVIQIFSGRSLELLEDIRMLGEGRGLRMLPVLRKPLYPASLLSIIEHEMTAFATSAAVEAPATPIDTADDAVDLGHALGQGWVEVWYQPKYDVATLEMVGAECLSRVRHPSRGILAPNLFLPGATTEDLAALTRVVLRQALLDWLDFDARDRPLRLAINIPGNQIVEMPLANMMRNLAPGSDRWPGLIFEITEEKALQDIEAARAVATQLKIYGVSLSIDDFGMGYSSFARLRELPFREIKLDRSLVDGCAIDEVKGALCRGVIEMAHSFGAKAVAEGVEHSIDLDYLRSIWCDLAQGFYFARPMPKAELMKILDS